MTPVVHWLGGWASSLQCWESNLRASFPAWEHRFLDSHKFLSKTPKDAGLFNLPRGHAVVAWSMGSLLAHRWLTSTSDAWPIELPLLSLCPIFRFTGPGGIAEPVLARMKSKLETQRDAVLGDFWKRMPGTENSDSAWRNAWRAGTRGYTTAELMEGLDFLQDMIVEPGTFPSMPRRWELWVGENDTLAPAGGWGNLLPKKVKVTHHPSGHLPFLECPHLIAEALERLSPQA